MYKSVYRSAPGNILEEQRSIKIGHMTLYEAYFFFPKGGKICIIFYYGVLHLTTVQNYLMVISGYSISFTS